MGDAAMIPCAADPETLRDLFAQATQGRDKFTRRIAIELADIVGLPPMSLVWRLEKMGLLKRGSWDWFKSNGGITKTHMIEARRASKDQPTPQEKQS